MNIILIGGPGSGKGSLSKMIVDQYQHVHISTGDILRNINSSNPLFTKVREKIDNGLFVDDELICQLVNNEIQNCRTHWILDGFPRNVDQFCHLISNILVTDCLFVFLQCDSRVLRDRMVGRMIHESSGRIYHKTNNPPKIDMVDDVTGEPLIVRKDDKIEFFDKRIEAYETLTTPIFDLCVNGVQKFNHIIIDTTLLTTAEVLNRVENKWTDLLVT